MGKMEERNAKLIRRTKINTAIIGVVAAAGVIAVAAVAPKLINLFSKSKYLRQRMYQSRSRLSSLITRGYMTVEMKNGKKYIRLTQKGEKFAALIHEGGAPLKKPKRWDGKWRLLIFDIPEQRKRIRGQIRSTLTALGFIRLQDSVWVYPYDCEDYMTILKADLRVGKDVLYIIADQIEYDKPLRSHFNLPEAA